MIQIVRDDIIYVINIVSANVMSTVSINSDHKKVRYTMDYYISHTVLLVVILLFIIAAIFYHYAKHKSKLKKLYALLEI